MIDHEPSAGPGSWAARAQQPETVAAGDGADWARLFAQIARQLAAQRDLGTTVERVVELSRTVLSCDSTAVWTLTNRDEVKLQAATDPDYAEQFTPLIGRTREGIVWECLHNHVTVRITDFRIETRWPRYRAQVLRSADPFLSAAGYSLDIEGRSIGALILASRQAHFFSDDLMRVGAIFAEHAAIGIEAAGAGQKAKNLELALASNRRIGMAIGILMSQLRLTEDQAFDMLRTASQRQHNKLREVAEEVIMTGTAPLLARREPS